MVERLSNSFSDFRINFLILFFSLLPILYLSTRILGYPVDLPFIDDFAIIPLLDQVSDNTLNYVDLFSQHNEHRLFFPRLIMLFLIKYFGWKTICFSIFSFIMALICFLIISFELIKLEKEEGTKISILLPLFSLFIFSISQAMNWMILWQIQIFMCILAVVAGSYFLTRNKLTFKLFILAAFSSFVASYSFGNGLSFWLIGFLLISSCRYENTTSKWLFLLLWSIIAIATIAFYMHGYKKPEYHPSLFIIFTNFPQFIDYVMSFLGGPVSISRHGAKLYGTLCFIIFIITALYLFWQKKIPYKNSILFFIALGLFTVISALTIAVGRAGFGAEQALSERYITFSNLIWIATYVMLFFSYKIYFRNRKSDWKKYVSKGTVIFSILICITALLSRASHDDSKAKDFSIKLSTLKTSISTHGIDSVSNTSLELILPDPSMAKKYLLILQKQNLMF